MSASLTINPIKLQQALKAFVGNTKLEAAKEMRIQARSLCVSLANSTQPFGLNAKAKAIGEKAVTRDIDRVYKTGSTAVREIGSLPIPIGKTKTQNAKQAAAALAALVLGKSFGKGKKGIGAQTAAQALIDRLNYKPYVYTRIGEFDRGSAHDNARFGKNKRVPKNQFVRQVVTKENELARYFKQKRGNVGIAKSGWAVCAGILGGFRGIPKWVYRHTGGGRVVDNSKAVIGAFSKPYISMTNTIPWIANVISKSTVQKSIDIQVIKMIKRLSIIANYERKKAGL
ncbi:MAG: hypothetical protein EBX40_00340 [Gammaproteobacteria bacterium]|nr:hypothetical protein [Gammaproteobacteria bacterium]